MIRAVIVDDEPLALRADAAPARGAAGGQCRGHRRHAGHRARTDRATRPDVVFLDIELGDGTGFDVIAGLSPAPKIILVTAHPRHAVEAFAVEAVDFLFKPVLAERLAAALGTRRAAGIRRGPTVELRMPNRTIFVRRPPIAALRADGDFTRVHLAGQPPLLILRTLAISRRCCRRRRSSGWAVGADQPRPRPPAAIARPQSVACDARRPGRRAAAGPGPRPRGLRAGHWPRRHRTCPARRRAVMPRQEPTDQDAGRRAPARRPAGSGTWPARPASP